jgi:hypothetical protein
MEQETELETKAKSAAALGLSLSSIDRLLRSAQLEGVKIGRRHTVRTASSKTLAAQGTARLLQKAG